MYSMRNLGTEGIEYDLDTKILGRNHVGSQTGHFGKWKHQRAFADGPSNQYEVCGNSVFLHNSCNNSLGEEQYFRYIKLTYLRTRGVDYKGQWGWDKHYFRLMRFELFGTLMDNRVCQTQKQNIHFPTTLFLITFFSVLE